MAGNFQDLEEFFDDTLRLPIGGKTYVVPPPDAETGIQMKARFELGLRILAGEVDPEEGDLDDDEEADLFQQTLGPVYDEMMADGVNWPRLKRAGMTAFYWIVGETSVAEQFWKTGEPVDPELQARAENRAERRRTRKSGSRSKSAGAVAKSTRSRGTTSGTKTRRKTA